ncbi:MAG: 50S ribosomal protein L17 [Thermoanaerobaculum sp.]|nr:50S ribosomal protein L17 [Thermoanaerobaculum sp.]MCX7894668.1 50S ribosomal protein L17 [Thermoanaerobaculum sp.]MDW7967819.1 50S ribosomal protein L17 [Thermoanaerobaculum sp.]
MRHNRAGRKLGRVTEHRRALFRNQLASLLTHERIITTLPKAKELRPIAERMVTLGRKNTVHARRLVNRWVTDRDLIKKLFSDIGPRFLTRPGGYTRIVKLGPRKGDGAELAILEFVDYKLPEATKSKEGKGAKAKEKSATA